MGIFDKPEPDILMRYYDKGEGFWRAIRRHICNVFRHFSGNAPLDYDERDMEEDAYEEWGWFNDQ